MDVRFYGKSPKIRNVTAYVVIMGDNDPGAEGGEKILLFPQDPANETLSLGNLCVSVRPEARGNPQIAAKLRNIISPLIEQAVIPLVAYCLEERLLAGSVTIDPSETAFLVVPSGGKDHDKRTFDLKTACAMPIAFLPASIGLGLNRSKVFHWVKVSEILNGYRLHGGEDEEHLAKMVLRAYLRG